MLRQTLKPTKLYSQHYLFGFWDMISLRTTGWPQTCNNPLECLDYRHEASHIALIVIFLYLNAIIIVCMWCLCGNAHATVYVWRPETTFESQFYLSITGSKQACGKHFYQLSQLFGLDLVVFLLLLLLLLWRDTMTATTLIKGKHLIWACLEIQSFSHYHHDGKHDSL